MGWILLFGPWNSSRGYRQTVSPWNRPERWGSGRMGGRLHVTEPRSSAIENGPVVSGLPAPVILTSLCTLLSPLATLSLNPKHALIGTPEVQVSIIFLSKEASVFFLQGINSELRSYSLSVNVKIHPLKIAVPALENTSVFSSPCIFATENLVTGPLYRLIFLKNE